MAHISALRAAFVLILAFPNLTIGAPTVVYDNTTMPTSGSYAPDGFWPFYVFDAPDPMGDQITLAGTGREIVEFDLILSSSQQVNLSSLTLAFYDLDPTIVYPGQDPDRLPGNQLWTTTLSNVLVDGITTMVFNVPNVVVPYTFCLPAEAAP